MVKESSSLATTKRLHKQNILNFLFGILFTAAIAFTGISLANLPVVERIGGMVTSILLAVLFRNLLFYPQVIGSGIQFSSKVLLRIAIIFYGFKLDVNTIINESGMLLLHGTITIFVSLAATVILIKVLHAEERLSLLLGIGTGVCGAAAIGAAAPILNADDEETAIGVGIIALMGTVFTLGYTLIWPYLSIGSELYGIWSGISLHEIAHVAAAAAPAGNDALAIALLAKLGRVLLLIPLCFLLSLWMRFKGGLKGDSKTPFPWFLVGFIFTSLINSYFEIPLNIINAISVGASLMLTTAMVGLGLNVHLSALRRAFLPLVIVWIVSVIVSVVSYYTLWFYRA